ncbi:helix-turn-helix domain-containing protein [Paenibacillus larvae]|nr:helix-turn-helix domain-containing protein [Paenibacillus larvae]
MPKKGGKTYAEIAEICGVHPNTIGNWRKGSDVRGGA